MKYGLLTYPNMKDLFNIGDYIQSLAAKQYLPNVDFFVNREELNYYNEEKIKMILNGWFMYNPKNFPPSENILPLFISFHLNSSYSDDFLNEKTIEYLIGKSPIGCRDFFTLERLQNNGIDAYYSGCLTLTLGESYRSTKKSDEILFVDELFTFPDFENVFSSPKALLKSILTMDITRLWKKKKLLKRIFTNELLSKTINLTHALKVKDYETYNQRFIYAEHLLERFANAKLVVTSRIHCALPCLAMGTPVIFLNGNFKKKSDQVRLKGIDHLFNTIFINGREITSNFNFNSRIGLGSIPSNKEEHLKMKEDLKNRCVEFINSNIIP